MSAPKFTPGPWAYKHDRVMDSEGAGVAHPQWQGRDDEEIGANGALIAAAPDLYEALETMMAHFEGRAGYSTAHHKARAALAKARGETP